MKKFIYLFILIFLVFGCSSSENNDELDQLQKQIDEHQKDIKSKQQSDSETVKKDTEISNIKSKLISNPSYIDIDKDIFSFCDRCPVSSIERGIVVIDYIMSNYVETDFDTFANKYYSNLNKFGWKKALSNAVGDYAVFENSFKQYMLN